MSRASFSTSSEETTFAGLYRPGLSWIAVKGGTVFAFMCFPSSDRAGGPFTAREGRKGAATENIKKQIDGRVRSDYVSGVSSFKERKQTQAVRVTAASTLAGGLLSVNTVIISSVQTSVVPRTMSVSDSRNSKLF